MAWRTYGFDVNGLPVAAWYREETVEQVLAPRNADSPQSSVRGAAGDTMESTDRTAPPRLRRERRRCARKTPPRM